MIRAPKSITVLRPGSGVDIGGVFATVTQVCITDAFAVTYEVLWWSGQDRKTAWVSPAQISPSNQPKLKIGFGGR